MYILCTEKEREREKSKMKIMSRLFLFLLVYFSGFSLPFYFISFFVFVSSLSSHCILFLYCSFYHFFLGNDFHVYRLGKIGTVHIIILLFLCSFSFYVVLLTWYYFVRTLTYFPFSLSLACPPSSASPSGLDEIYIWEITEITRIFILCEIV